MKPGAPARRPPRRAAARGTTGTLAALALAALALPAAAAGDGRTVPSAGVPADGQPASGHLATPAPDAAARPCRLPQLPHAALCGSVRRPLDPARPRGPQIDVHYAVLPALARHKAPDPVFFFAGGPGQSAIRLAGLLAQRWGRLNQRRDLVFVDQRGTGRSAPLYCADDDERAALGPLADALDADRRAQRLQVCRQALQALPHGDLRFYTTTLASTDVDAVRATLGVQRLNAIGASYGTRAVLDYQRQFPQRVRRAVLDGVAPPDMRLPEAAARDNQAALDALARACAADAGCAARHPTLPAQWAALLAGLPRTVRLPHPVSGREETLRLDRDAALALLRAPLYAPALAAGLPAASAEAAQGRWAPLAALSAALGGGGAAGAVATGQHLSVVCSEDLGPATPHGDPADRAAAAAPGNLFGAAFAAHYAAQCADWPRAAVDPAFYRLAPATAPTWLLSGTADPVTPPRHAERVLRALGARARHTVVPHAGHGVLALACLRDAAQRFITEDDDDAALAGIERDGACAAALPAPRVFEPPGTATAEGGTR